MKRLLLVAPEFVLPVNTGGRVRTWNFVQALKDRYELNLIHPYRHPSDLDQLAQAKEYFTNIWSVRISGVSCRRSISLGQRLSQLTRPWELDYSYFPEFAEGLSTVARTESFDVVLARYIHQARYVFELRPQLASRLVVDIDDIEPVKLAREHDVAGSTSAYLRSRTRLNIAAFGRYHRRHLPSVDTCIVCSDEDRQYVERRQWSSRVAVVPNAIDMGGFETTAIPSEIQTLLFCGTLSYLPNVDGILWFVRNVWPHVRQVNPTCRLQVVGRGAVEAVRALDREPGISVHSDVDDVRPYYHAASAVIVPLRIGGGTRIKILEAAALRRPVISTTIGAEGLRVTAGRHCLIEDSALHFAAGCCELLSNTSLVSGLVAENYELVRSRYDVPIVTTAIQRVLDSSMDREDGLRTDDAVHSGHRERSLRAS